MKSQRHREACSICGVFSHLSKLTKRLRRTPHHFGLQVVSDGGRYVASCYHERRYRQAREFPQPSIQGQPQGKLGGESDGKVAQRREKLTRSASTNTLCVVTTLEQTVHTTDRELKASLGRTRLGLCLAGGGLARTRLARFATFAGHVSEDCRVVSSEWKGEVCG